VPSAAALHGQAALAAWHQQEKARCARAIGEPKASRSPVHDVRIRAHAHRPPRAAPTRPQLVRSERSPLQRSDHCLSLAARAALKAAKAAAKKVKLAFDQGVDSWLRRLRHDDGGGPGNGGGLGGGHPLLA